MPIALRARPCGGAAGNAQWRTTVTLEFVLDTAVRLGQIDVGVDD